MTPQEFGKALLRSAKKLDVPATGAKGRAFDSLATSTVASASMAAASQVTTGVATGVARAKMNVLAWSLAGAAVAAGVGGFTVARVTADKPDVAPIAASHDPVSLPSPSAPLQPPAAAAASPITRGEEAAAPDMCTQHTLAESPPKVCSQRGTEVPMSVRNGCGGDVDVFWVDFNCEEVIYKRLPPGESYFQTTYDTHPWRVRDHATHALLKEFTAQRVPGAPVFEDKAPPAVLPDVVVHADERPNLDDPKPPVCSRAGTLSKFTFKNERSDKVVLFWVGLDCAEKFWKGVGPKHSEVISGRQSDAWRVRDAKTGALLLDIEPEAPDTTAYISVP